MGSFNNSSGKSINRVCCVGNLEKAEHEKKEVVVAKLRTWNLS
jgi:hypothetical protein